MSPRLNADERLDQNPCRISDFAVSLVEWKKLTASGTTWLHSDKEYVKSKSSNK